jgi:membrane dipeptidase
MFKKRWVRIVVCAVALLLIAVLVIMYTVVPGRVMSALNFVTQRGPYTVRPDAQAFHNTLLVVDLHADALLWSRDIAVRDTRGHVDIPRLIAGGIALQGFGAPTRIPSTLNIESNPDKNDLLVPLVFFQGWPADTWNSAFRRALYQAQRLEKAAKDSNGAFVLIKTREDLERYLERRKTDPKVTAGFLSIEGLHCLDGKLENVDALYAAGYRMMAPTHFFDNQLGGSAHGLEKFGITEFGKAVIARMEELHILLDLAHASPKLFDDSLAVSKRPVMISHTGVKGTADNRRNLDDAQLRAVAATGGVIGIGFWETATGGKDAASIVRAIKYAAEVAGVEHVGLGSDWDGATETPFDATGAALITQGLLDAGMPPVDIAKLMGMNTLRVLLANLPQEGAVPAPANTP